MNFSMNHPYEHNVGNELYVPIHLKQNLTLDEAVLYSNIGKNKLGELVRHPKCNFVLRIGNRRLIKRRLFDEFIESVEWI